MSQYRTPTTKSTYFLDKEVYLTTLHYCKQYPLWVAELDTEPDTSKAIVYDKEKVQTSNSYDATSETAMRRIEIAKKKAKVDEISVMVAGDMAHWLRMGVCYGSTFPALEAKGIPCVSKTYYRLRRRFYYELSKVI